MTFDELVEKKEGYIRDPCESWDDPNVGAASVEMEDCPLDVLQWYLRLILRSL